MFYMKINFFKSYKLKFFSPCIIQLRCKNGGYRGRWEGGGGYKQRFQYPSFIKLLMLVYQIIMTYRLGFEKESKSIFIKTLFFNTCTIIGLLFFQFFLKEGFCILLILYSNDRGPSIWLSTDFIQLF